NYIGQEHILLGLIRVEEGVAAKVLTDLGIGPDKVRSSVEFLVGRGNVVVEGDIGFTPRAKKALDLARDEALRFNHHYIGTEHILLGLLREGEGMAAGVLENLGVSLEQARATVLKLLSQGLPPGPKGVDRLIAQWMERERVVKRYNLALPEDLHDEVQSLADRQQTTVVEVLRRFIRLGLLVTEVQERTGTALIIRDGEREREILLL
ncbi:MAG: Clp protease N-terminal domain-containing protein, partial [Dehalococcoidia bacterium]